MFTVTNEEIDSSKTIKYYNRPEHIAELMGIDYVNSWEKEESEKEVSYKDFYAGTDSNLNVTGVNWIIRNAYWAPQSDSQEYTVNDGRTVVVESNNQDPYIRVFITGNEQEAISFNVNPFIQQLRKRYPDAQNRVAVDDMMLRDSAGDFSAALYFENITYRISKADSLGLENVKFMIGIK